VVYDENYPSSAPVGPPVPFNTENRTKLRPTLLKTQPKPSDVQDEMKHYLSSAIIDSNEDPIQFWVRQSQKYPERQLWRMALDYLSAAATSCDPERAFSHGALTVTHLRHSLSDKSTRASIVAGAWVSEKGLIPEEDLVGLYRNKLSHRARAPRQNIDLMDDTVDGEMNIDENVSQAE
jgi:hypothetical protein